MVNEDMALRPASIARFERLYLGSVVVGIVGSVLDWDRMLERIRSTPDSAQLGSAVAGVAVGTVVIGVLISLLLWYLVARRGSVIAKWVLTAFLAFSAFSVLIGLLNGVIGFDVGGLVRLTGFALQLLAVTTLFRADAAPWFDRGPVVVDGEETE